MGVPAPPASTVVPLARISANHPVDLLPMMGGNADDGRPATQLSGRGHQAARDRHHLRRAAREVQPSAPRTLSPERMAGHCLAASASARARRRSRFDSAENISRAPSGPDTPAGLRQWGRRQLDDCAGRQPRSGPSGQPPACRLRRHQAESPAVVLLPAPVGTESATISPSSRQGSAFEAWMLAVSGDHLVDSMSAMYLDGSWALSPR